MMNKQEREKALNDMQVASNEFYARATHIGNHPFIEFTGLINEYIKTCRAAHNIGIDFSECSKHSGKELPMKSFQIDYVNEKLECIFTGNSFSKTKPKHSGQILDKEADFRISNNE